MKLVHLSIGTIGVCLVGIVALLTLSLWSFDRIQTQQAELGDLVTLKSQIDNLSVASDNLLLYTPDPALWQAYLANARDIQQHLLTYSDTQPSAQRAAYHIDQLIESIERVYEQTGEAALSPAIDGIGPLEIPLRAHVVMSQVANHGIALDATVDELLIERQRAIHRNSTRVMVVLMTAALLFGVLCVLAFALIYWRIAGPTRELAKTIRQIRAGDPRARAVVCGSDEIADLAHTLNALLDQQHRASDRIQQQQIALTEQAQLLQIGGEVARFGGWSVDLATSQCHWSDMVAEIHGRPHGYSPKVEEGISYYAPEYRDRIRDVFTQCAQLGVPYDEELQIINAQGERRWVRTIGVPLRNDQGHIVRVQGAFQDITERVSLEARLRQSQQLESIGQLTGGIAHDFNNLLTVIMGNAELLAEQLPEDSELHLLTAMILKGAHRGADLTHHLLAFARKQPLAPSLVDINALVGHMCHLLQRTLGEHIRVELHCAAALWPVLVDPAQLESALLNLALNARDAMTPGGRLIIETTNTELDQDYAQAQGNVTPGLYVQITVSDDGCGIPPENMEHLFEPFFTTKETGKGTGLGLPMVYGFVKQSNGHIMIYSEPQRGTTVKMYFPRVATMDTPEISPQSQPPTTQTTQGSTILVVEDDAMVRRYVESQLLSLGYQVVSARNGPQGLDILQHRPDIDLLFTDMVMPGGMTGCDLADRARAIRPDLRVLYTSGYTETAVVHHGRLDLGGQLLSKPYRREELAAKLQAALSNLPTDGP